MSLANFSWVIKDSLAGMAHPGERLETFAKLKARGIGAVVTLTVHSLPQALLSKNDLAYLHLPIENFEPPTLPQIRNFVKFCEKNLRAGRPVAVHCLAGIGRTGTMLACYMVWQGMPPDQAISALRKLRPASIETVGQERAVFDFAAQLPRDPELQREKPPQ